MVKKRSAIGLVTKKEERKTTVKGKIRM